MASSFDNRLHSRQSFVDSTDDTAFVKGKLALPDHILFANYIPRSQPESTPSIRPASSPVITSSPLSSIPSAPSAPSQAPIAHVAEAPHNHNSKQNMSSGQGLEQGCKGSEGRPIREAGLLLEARQTPSPSAVYDEPFAFWRHRGISRTQPPQFRAGSLLALSYLCGPER